MSETRPPIACRCGDRRHGIDWTAMLRTPEEEARQKIDRQLKACGWRVQNRNEADITADLTVPGHTKGLTSIMEPLQLICDSDAVRALAPVGNKALFTGLPEDVVERSVLVFYGDIDPAVLKTLEM